MHSQLGLLGQAFMFSFTSITVLAFGFFVLADFWFFINKLSVDGMAWQVSESGNCPNTFFKMLAAMSR